MVVANGPETLTFADVQIGEVWLAGGQSNMEFHMRYDLELNEAQKTPREDIRFFDYPEVSYVGQIDEADYGKNYLRWRKAVPSELERFSAVGFYFAVELREKLGVPVVPVESDGFALWDAVCGLAPEPSAPKLPEESTEYYVYNQ